MASQACLFYILHFRTYLENQSVMSCLLFNVFYIECVSDNAPSPFLCHPDPSQIHRWPLTMSLLICSTFRVITQKKTFLSQKVCRVWMSLLLTKWYVSKFRREQRTEFQCPLCGKVRAVEDQIPSMLWSDYQTGDLCFVSQVNLCPSIKLSFIMMIGLLKLSQSELLTVLYSRVGD